MDLEASQWLSLSNHPSTFQVQLDQSNNAMRLTQKLNIPQITTKINYVECILMDHAKGTQLKKISIKK